MKLSVKDNLEGEMARTRARVADMLRLLAERIESGQMVVLEAQLTSEVLSEPISIGTFEGGEAYTRSILGGEHRLTLVTRS